MGKANFNSNNIFKSKSLAVNIQNSTNIPKGALIRVLHPSNTKHLKADTLRILI